MGLSTFSFVLNDWNWRNLEDIERSSREPQHHVNKMYPEDIKISE